MSIRNTLIRLSYSKVIDSESSSIWDKQVFTSTFREYQFQALQFDPEGTCPLFQDLLKANPRSSAMHYLVSTATIELLRDLNGKMPDLTNETNQPVVPYKNFQFEILQSHRKDLSRHRIRITLVSEELLCIDSIQKQLILTTGEEWQHYCAGEEVKTFTLLLNPEISICSVRSIQPTAQ